MKSIALGAVATTIVTLAACGGDSNPSDSSGGSDIGPVQDTPATQLEQFTELDLAVCDPATQSFTFNIDNPFLPMPEGRRLVLEGDDEGVRVRLEVDVIDKFESVGGITTRVVAETEYKDDELYERSFNYFAQASDGTVCYFGEEVEFFEDDEVISRDGSWRAEGSNRPGIQMPAMPAVGTQYYQEWAPGEAEDKSAVRSINATANTPAGNFTNVVEVTDWNPLEGETIEDGERKRFASGVGLIEDESLQLVASRGALTNIDLSVCDPDIQAFSLDITNPYNPLPVGRVLELEGEDDGEMIHLEVRVLDRTEQVGTVTTRVVTETETIDGQLFERTFNYFAQAASGAVCYFGEDVEFYENGVIIDRHGSWRADGAGNKPGIQMPANPAADTQFMQESAPGEATDKAFVAEMNATVLTPAGAFPGSVRTRDWNPLDGDSFLDAEDKAYAPGVGLIQDHRLLLVRMQ